jgi:hypothetical protein
MPLADVLPRRVVQTFEVEARAAGIPSPVSAAQAYRPELAHALWTDLTPNELADPQLDGICRRRSREAGGDLRRLVDLVRAGETLLLFPEGRPSPNGMIGPLERGLSLVIGRGQPEGIVPIGIAYDHLTRGRPLVYIAADPPIPPPTEDIADAVLAELRRMTPLTCGQIVADLLVRAARAGQRSVSPADAERAFAAELERTREARRPFDRAFLESGRRRQRLTDCLLALARRGAVRVAGPRFLELDPDAVLRDARLLWLAREYDSARA